jgi:peptidyl-prolyl cis-trans isomerase A (cyclophilin A)
MTQIRRHKGGWAASSKEQKRTLVCVAVAVLSTLMLVVLFLQIDSWPSKHNHARMIKPPGLTPGVVGTELLESITTNKQQQNLRRAGRGGEQNERRPIPVEEEEEEGGEQAEEDVGDEEAEEEGAARSPDMEPASGDGGIGNLAPAPEQEHAEEQQPQPQLQLQSRTFVMELENLKPDPEINNNNSGSSSSTSTRGTVVFETRPEWAPIGVQHFHDLVDANFYNQCRFFRVVDNFVVQFGIAADPTVQAQWKGTVLKDDAVATTNAPGTLTYATSGKDTRTTQLFINTNKRGNKFLDAQGFAPFAIVTKGMEHVYRINNEYGEKPGQGKLQQQGNSYLQREFPLLSYIHVIRPATAQD